MFIKINLKIQIRSHKEAITLLSSRSEINLEDKSLYYKRCAFTFNVYQYPNIPGYDQLLKKKMYSSKNKDGLTRDHIVSRMYGFENNIDPYLISHPANCELISMSENVKKGSGCNMTVEELKRRVQEWNDNPSKYKKTIIKKRPKTQQHREKLSKANKGTKIFTNGIVNFRLKPSEDESNIPQGFWRGMTRRW